MQNFKTAHEKDKVILEYVGATVYITYSGPFKGITIDTCSPPADFSVEDLEHIVRIYKLKCKK